MRLIAATLVLVVMPLVASAHHSHAEFGDDTQEVEGELVSVIWRNPHPSLTLKAPAGRGQEMIWRVQVQGNVNGLSREGVTGDQFAVGDHVRIVGQVSGRREGLLLATIARFEDGTEIILAPDESSGAAVYRSSTAPAAASGAEPSSEEPSLFRVWTVADRVRNPNLPLREAARAAKETWDPVIDDPQRDCRPLGMPGAMMSPHPIEFLQSGDNLILRMEEWDARRTIRMGAQSRGQNRAPSSMGYSVGRWEGATLVVTTTDISYPYLDEHGTPQSDAVEVVERFTPSPDGRSLAWAATVTDRETLTEPVVAFTTRWEWVPGEEIQPYDCAELDALFDN